MKSVMLEPFDEGLVLTLPKEAGAEGEVSVVTRITMAKGSTLRPDAARATFDVTILPPAPPMHDFRSQLGCCGKSYMEDESEVKNCTWLHFVRFTENPKDANLVCRRRLGEWVFEATDKISPNEILVVYRCPDGDSCDLLQQLTIKSENSVGEDEDTPMSMAFIKGETKSEGEEETETEGTVKQGGKVNSAAKVKVEESKAKTEVKDTAEVKANGKVQLKDLRGVKAEDEPSRERQRRRLLDIPTEEMMRSILVTSSHLNQSIPGLAVPPSGSLRTPLTTETDASSPTPMDTSDNQQQLKRRERRRRWNMSAPVIAIQPPPEDMEVDSEEPTTSGALDLSSRRPADLETEAVPSTSTGITHDFMEPLGHRALAAHMAAGANGGVRGRARRRGGREGQQERPRRTMRTCSWCGLSFDRPSLLERHKRTHTGEKPYECSVCKKAFSTSSSRNTHVRIHTKEKPHRCPICGKCFTASSNLYYHKMTHQKTKPYPCTQCSKSFPTPGDLRNHSYTHTGNYPVWCRVCRHGFPKQSNLNAHMKTHEGKRTFTCRICRSTFHTPADLRTHMKTHSEKKEERCARCALEFPKEKMSNGLCPDCSRDLCSPGPSSASASASSPFFNDKNGRRCRRCRKEVSEEELNADGLCPKCSLRHSSSPPASNRDKMYTCKICSEDTPLAFIRFESRRLFKEHMALHFTVRPCRTCNVQHAQIDLSRGMCPKCRRQELMSAIEAAGASSTSLFQSESRPSDASSSSTPSPSAAASSTNGTNPTCTTASSSPSLPATAKTTRASKSLSSNFFIDSIIRPDNRSRGDTPTADRALDLRMSWGAPSTSASSSSEAVVTSHAFGPYPGPSVSRGSPHLSPRLPMVAPNGSPSAAFNGSQSFFPRSMPCSLPAGSGSSPPTHHHPMAPYVTPSPFLPFGFNDPRLLPPHRFQVSPNMYPACLNPYASPSSNIHFTGVFHYTGLRPWGCEAPPPPASPAPPAKPPGRPSGPRDLPM